METHDDDQPSQEGIQKQGTSDDQQQEAASPVRFYDCTFCMRGFSNAQALGGHMNIHRKDKDKLKQAAASSNINHQNRQPFNISRIRASYDPVLSIKPSMEVTAAAIQWPNWIIRAQNDAPRKDKTHHGEVGKLPLFVERSPSLRNDQRAACSSPEKHLVPSSSEEEDLDLELRLGPEPHQDSSTSATGTKKFF